MKYTIFERILYSLFALFLTMFIITIMFYGERHQYVLWNLCVLVVLINSLAEYIQLGKRKTIPVYYVEWLVCIAIMVVSGCAYWWKMKIVDRTMSIPLSILLVLIRIRIYQIYRKVK
ncbi:MAG: hypothetical protein A2350_20805 [Candidatus Raymondbacteria bacterium RifOxyB12_full_50_8]|nr:MAG: hypothetical protein A2350_20805 [Candidatus Raymondbacteria bacterium RifOxyB12_full_50_8]